MGTVGIIANPYSSKDIRRLTGSARIVTDWEKVNVLRRIIIGLQSFQVGSIVAMDDNAHLVRRAINHPGITADVEFLELPIRGNANDTLLASQHMAEKQIDVLISLGGDGTNRMIAKGFDKHTVLPVSTGTNNVFPYDLEGTHIGICAGLIASQAVDKNDCTVQSKQIVVTLENGDKDLALVDLAISTANFVASRAIWDFNNLDEVFLTRCELLDLGLASVGARLQTIGIEDEQGLMYKIAKASEVSKKVLSPIGPGTIQEVLISDWGLINRGQVITRNISRCTLAFDGEREIQITNEQNIQIELIRKGPFIVDVSACLEHAVQQGDFYLE